MIERRYVRGRFGQVHLRESGVASGAVPLVCLHATAYSSRSFEALMRALAQMPGYLERVLAGGRDLALVLLPLLLPQELKFNCPAFRVLRTRFTLVGCSDVRRSVRLIS